MTSTLEGLLDPLIRIGRDLRMAGLTLGDNEARFLVDYYYIVQDDRKRAYQQESALNTAEEPHQVITWLAENSRRIEDSIKGALAAYADGQPMCQWAQSIIGIGPIISAGLHAHIDVTKSPSTSNLWSFAGVNPEAHWERGAKRPWNAGLKVLAWKAGESFVKTCNHRDSFYGPYYQRWKAEEETMNAAGKFADQAAEKLKTTRIGKTTEAYKHYSAGFLPPAHVHSRATRKVRKLFLSHWWTVAYEMHYGQPPSVMPYVVDRLGHKDYVAPPNWPR